MVPSSVWDVGSAKNPFFLFKSFKNNGLASFINTLSECKMFFTGLIGILLFNIFLNIDKNSK